jgi:hypothetical protein
MANDPNIPGTVDPNQAENLTQVANAAKQAHNAFGLFGEAVNFAKETLGGLYDQVNKTSANFATNQRLTENQSAAFGLLATSVLGTRKAFDSLNNVDTSRLNTFSKQWTDLQNVLSNSPGIKTAKDVTQATVDFMVKAGAPLKEIQTAIAKGIGGLKSYAEAFFESADNALRLQNSIIQLAAKTGGLNEVLRVAGPNLENLNQLTATYQKSISDASTATDVSQDIMEQYYAQLSTVPKAMQAMVKSSSDSTKNVSLLTAATQYSIGSGRDYKDVVEDLRTALRNYNITGEEALRFTARMGEISNKFGLELSDVKTALSSTSENFKMFGNEAEGAAKMMNLYLGSLESTGLSGAASIDVIQGITTGLKNLGIAQKAFVSAQTGGPGGLMGGYQIEEMLREGKIDQVMEKVKATLTRHMGPLVSLKEAAESPQAAAQMTKQIAMLRQGPLGSFARDDQTAMRIIEAMKNQQSGKTLMTELSKPGEVGSTQEIMRTGVEFQKKSHTELTHIRQLIQNTQGMAGIANLTTAQRNFTAGVGAPIREGEFASQYRRDMSRDMQKAATASGQTTQDLADALSSGVMSTRQTVGRATAGLGADFESLVQEIPEALRAPIDNIKSMLSHGNTEGAMAAYKEQVADLNARAASLKNVPQVARGAEASQIANQKAILQSSMQDMMRGGTIDTSPINGTTAVTDRAMEAIDNIRTLPNLGDAASIVAHRGGGTTTATGSPTGTPMHPHSVATETAHKELGEITVHIEGYCLDCGEKIRSRSQSYAVAPQTK